jgi:hypothetical protein
MAGRGFAHDKLLGLSALLVLRRAFRGLLLYDRIVGLADRLGQFYECGCLFVALICSCRLGWKDTFPRFCCLVVFFFLESQIFDQ